MKLSIIIVSYNVIHRLRENLHSLMKSELDFDIEVFVVDNNSSDGSADMVIKEFPQVKLIQNSSNLGFARANNIAVKMSRGEYVLLLNPDMKTERSTIEKMVSWMDKNPQATVASCKLIDHEKHVIQNVRHFPGLFDQLCIVLKIPHIYPSVLHYYLYYDFDYNRDARVDSVRGSFFMIRANEDRDLLLLDERYFIWFEEVDYCRQVEKNGGQVWYCSECDCIDYVGSSFSQIPRGIKQRYFKRSMLKYFQKWHPYWQYFVLKIAWSIVTLPVLTLTFFHVKSRTKT